jgi:hypothetical protein
LLFPWGFLFSLSGLSRNTQLDKGMNHSTAYTGVGRRSFGTFLRPAAFTATFDGNSTPNEQHQAPGSAVYPS